MGASRDPGQRDRARRVRDLRPEGGARKRGNPPPALAQDPRRTDGHADEIGPLICLLASPLSDFITGSVFVADGGESSKLMIIDTHVHVWPDKIAARALGTPSEGIRRFGDGTVATRWNRCAQPASTALCAWR